MAVEVITFDANIDPFLKRMRQIGVSIDKVRKTTEKSAKASVASNEKVRRSRKQVGETEQQVSRAVDKAVREILAIEKREQKEREAKTKRLQVLATKERQLRRQMAADTEKNVARQVRATERLRKAQERTSRGLDKSGKLVKKNNFIFRELAFAVDDAAQTFGTGGLAGALRGAGNNLSFVALMAGGPIAGALTGVSIAAAGLALNQRKSAKASREQVDAFAEVRDAIDESRRALDDLSLTEEERARKEVKRKGLKLIEPIAETIALARRKERKGIDDVAAAEKRLAREREFLRQERGIFPLEAIRRGRILVEEFKLEAAKTAAQQGLATRVEAESFLLEQQEINAGKLARFDENLKRETEEKLVKERKRQAKSDARDLLQAAKPIFVGAARQALAAGVNVQEVIDARLQELVQAGSISPDILPFARETVRGFVRRPQRGRPAEPLELIQARARLIERQAEQARARIAPGPRGARGIRARGLQRDIGEAQAAVQALELPLKLEELLEKAATAQLTSAEQMAEFIARQQEIGGGPPNRDGNQ